MPKRENKKNLILREITRCVLLEEEDKTSLLSTVNDAPESLLDTMYEFFKEKNDLVDLYVTRAIESDPEVVTEMKNKVYILKKHILEYQEAEEKDEERAEEMLEEAIEDL